MKKLVISVLMTSYDMPLETLEQRAEARRRVEQLRTDLQSRYGGLFSVRVSGEIG